MNPRGRKALGCAFLLLYLTLYIVFAAALGIWLAPRLPVWAELIYYAVAGIVWALPLKPMFDWMKRGAPTD